MPGTGTFGVFKLGTLGAEIILPECTKFREDPVIQGGKHILLNGKMKVDELGTRRHFFLEFQGITNEEYTTLTDAWEASAPLSFQTHDTTYSVVRGNHGPKEYDSVGHISTSIELDET